MDSGLVVGLLVALIITVTVTAFTRAISSMRNPEEDREKIKVKNRPKRPAQPSIMPRDIIDIEECRDGTYRRVKGRRPRNLPMDGRK